MSEHATKTPMTEQIVTSDTALVNSKKRGMGAGFMFRVTHCNKRHLIGSVLALVIVVAAVVAYLTVFRENTPPIPAADVSAKLYEQAAAGSKDANTVASQLKKHADDAKNPNDKATYRLAESRAALLANNYSEAHDAGMAVERLKPSAGSAAVVAYSYLNTGDKQAAIKYFKLAAERSPKPAHDDARAARTVYLSKAYNLEDSQ